MRSINNLSNKVEDNKMKDAVSEDEVSESSLHCDVLKDGCVLGVALDPQAN